MDTASTDTVSIFLDYEKERACEESQLKALSKKVSNLHPSVLFYKDTTKLGEACLKAKRSFAVNVSPIYLDLGLSLGIKQGFLDAFRNNDHYVPGDLLLQYYSYTSDDCLDTILDQLVELKQFSILKELYEPFTKLVQCFNDADSGYQSSKSLPSKQCFMECLIREMAPMLEKYLPKKKIEPYDDPYEQPPKGLSLNPSDSLIPDDHRFIFLTFTPDGLQTALKIKEYSQNWTEPKLKALSLSDICYATGKTPEQCIREYFPKALFVIPIFTSGYFNEINKTHTDTANLDHKFVRYIHNLIYNSFVQMSINMNVRCVLPSNASKEVYQSISSYPELEPWTHVDNFNDQFRAFIEIATTI